MCTILLVGDASTEMESLEEVLRRYHHRIIRSRDGRTALEAVMGQGEAPDIIVADIDASGMEGLDFLVPIRHALRRLPVVLLSARGSMESYLLARNLGANAYVLKSTKVKNMERMITAIVTEGQRSGAQLARR